MLINVRLVSASECMSDASTIRRAISRSAGSVLGVSVRGARRRLPPRHSVQHQAKQRCSEHSNSHLSSGNHLQPISPRTSHPRNHSLVLLPLLSSTPHIRQALFVSLRSSDNLSPLHAVLDPLLHHVMQHASRARVQRIVTGALNAS